MLILPISVFAAKPSFSAYSSITASSSQSSILLGYYINSAYFNKDNEYIIICTSQNDYSLFAGKNLSSDTVYRFRYYRNNTDNQYHYAEETITGGINYSLSTYTAVGNIDGTITDFDYSETVYFQSYRYYILFTLIAILFMIFRVKEHKYC